ncbi:MAG: DUF5000 domain-containing lipoprotein [Candidatus Pseudobacter hemicellulosilyticus]|uniref:DUF5000 domain-containing lipoprotein n=1 Tax=Candidatus Pseudobacter hemicellulosilyticus TaxID=3121375 RepID=A0AAJ6BGD3_9BACT|nr:MAG: DUF5000 domain-containing lipoprotein [Pseudobacter sp.]
MKCIFYSCCIGLLLMASCTRMALEPVDNDGKAPGPVSQPVVENRNGSVSITFTPPADPDLAYVTASYTTRSGITRENKVSRYSNVVTLDGFPDEDNYVITLQAVDKGENKSTPVEVTAKPLKPVYRLAFDSLAAEADFGGINISFKNWTEANLAIVVLTNDSLGNFVPTYTHYTDLKSGNFSARGFDAVERTFGIFVRDRWGNISDTMNVTVVPFFEQLLDRTKMKAYALPTDAALGYSGTFAGLFDNRFDINSYYHSDGKTGMPQQFTFDMGVSAKLSRMVFYLKPDQAKYYDEHSPRIIELWGSESPNPDGSYDDTWTLLTTYTMEKPSGSAQGSPLTQADINFIEQGITVPIPVDAPKVRHVRFKTLRNWGNTIYVYVFEIQMFGDPN